MRQLTKKELAYSMHSSGRSIEDIAVTLKCTPGYVAQMLAVETTPITKEEIEAHVADVKRLRAEHAELLAYAKCEEAYRVSLLPTHKGGSGNGQSYIETFNQHGWDGNDVYGFLDRLRRTALAKAEPEESQTTP